MGFSFPKGVSGRLIFWGVGYNRGYKKNRAFNIFKLFFSSKVNNLQLVEFLYYT